MIVVARKDLASEQPQFSADGLARMGADSIVRLTNDRPKLRTGAAMTSLNDLFTLSGKTALVTGGATGIGRMAATGLAAAGARVLIASRKAEMCEATAAEINALGHPGSVEGFAGDVATAEGLAALAAEVQSRTDRLDILMNNAGAT